MKYKVQLVSDEVAIKTIDQNLTSRAFLFWRKFTITLTNKRLHTFQKFVISHAQRSFDLRDVDSIFQEKRFNGIYSFFFGFLLMIVIVGFSLLLRMHFYGSLLVEEDPIRKIADYIGICVWIIVFSLFFFKRVLVIRSRNDRMAINVFWMPQQLISDFVQDVLSQKEILLAQSNNIKGVVHVSTSEAMKQLNSLLNEGLITQSEYDTKKKELLARL